MPTDHILDLLLLERDKLTRAIEALQGTTRRGGRPRKNVTPTIDAEPATPATARKPAVWTPAMRRAASIRAKRAYAKRQAGAGKKR
jgi:hypothetical protein